jgi:glycosyltransferase involved in cell wall biosynthesis
VSLSTKAGQVHQPPVMGKRVCVLTTVHRPFEVDVRVFHRECKALSEAGFDVTLIAPHHRDEVIDGILIVAIPSPRRRLVRMTLGVLAALRKAVQLDADVYHFHDPELILAGLLLRAKGKRVIYDIHEDVAGQILSKYYLPRWSRRLVSCLVDRMEKVASRAFTALIAATPPIAARFCASRRPIVVVQNFPLHKELAPAASAGWKARSFAVGYIGTITEIRGIAEMVQAMGLLPKGLPATLELAGTWSPDTLRQRVSDLPGWDRAKDLGFQDRDGVASLLGRARAGLVLFHREPNHEVSYPTKMFEYMSAGIPVIASDFPLWRRIIEEARCGLLVDPKNPKAIADAIAYILTHDKEAEAMGQAGLDAARFRYDWAAEARKLVELYKNVTGQSAVARERAGACDNQRSHDGRV